MTTYYEMNTLFYRTASEKGELDKSLIAGSFPFSCFFWNGTHVTGVVGHIHLFTFLLQGCFAEQSQ